MTPLRYDCIILPASANAIRLFGVHMLVAGRNDIRIEYRRKEDCKYFWSFVCAFEGIWTTSTDSNDAHISILDIVLHKQQNINNNLYKIPRVWISHRYVCLCVDEYIILCSIEQVKHNNKRKCAFHNSTNEFKPVLISYRADSILWVH